MFVRLVTDYSYLGILVSEQYNYVMTIYLLHEFPGVYGVSPQCQDLRNFADHAGAPHCLLALMSRCHDPNPLQRYRESISAAAVVTVVSPNSHVVILLVHALCMYGLNWFTSITT